MEFFNFITIHFKNLKQLYRHKKATRIKQFQANKVSPSPSIYVRMNSVNNNKQTKISNHNRPIFICAHNTITKNKIQHTINYNIHPT